jgi:DNA gyrase subunit A
MIKKTADLVNDKKIEGISNILDESDREGMRIVYEIKRDAMANVVLNKLYKYTELQTSFSVNNIALVKGRPMLLNLKDMIHHFVDHRHEVVVRRTKFELSQAEKRAHILQGYLIALDHLDEVIKLIRDAATPDEAREGLMSNFGLTEIQAKAILEMRLRALTGLERDKIKEEYEALMKQIAYLNEILSDEGLRMKIIKDELVEIRDKYGDERKTEIVFAGEEFRMEDLIEEEDVVITISHMGYIKRTPLTEYRVQNRGGRGSIGSASRDEDFLEHIFVVSTHNYILFFTEKGKCFWLKGYEIPEGNKNSKGRAIQNLINITPDDKVKAYINVRSLEDEEYINNHFIILCSRQGTIKKTSLEAYSRPRQNGINAITVKDNDMLLEARLTNGTDEVLLASKQGKLVRFNESKVRPMGRNASGVRGIRLAPENDEVIGMITMSGNTKNVMVVSEKGFGKRSEMEEYRITNRGGKGVKTINITEKTGTLVSIMDVDDTNDIIIINRSGLTIRLSVADLRVIGRVSQGVKLINLQNEDEIAAVTKVEHVEEVETEIGTPETTGSENQEGGVSPASEASENNDNPQA